MKFTIFFDKSPYYKLKPHQTGYTPIEYRNTAVVRANQSEKEKWKTIFHESFHIRFHKFMVFFKKIGFEKMMDFLAELYAENCMKRGKKFYDIKQYENEWKGWIIQDTDNLLDILRYLF